MASIAVSKSPFRVSQFWCGSGRPMFGGLLASAIWAMAWVSPVWAASLVTFEDVVTGGSIYGFDSDGNSSMDVVFSTSRPFFDVPPITSSFLTGRSMAVQSLDVPGSPDLRVTFENGAVGAVNFGFVYFFAGGPVPDAAYVSAFDASNVLLVSTGFPSIVDPLGSYCNVGFIFGRQCGNNVSFLFPGVASRIDIDFRYINFPRSSGEPLIGSSASIDNFSFNSAPIVASIPEPSEWTLMIIGFGAAGSVIRRRKVAVA